MSAARESLSVNLSRSVLKYEVPPPDSDSRSYVRMEADAEILSVGIQGDTMVVWALCPCPMDYADRELIVVNTGITHFPFRPDSRFLGTVSASTGIVWHVWEVPRG